MVRRSLTSKLADLRARRSAVNAMQDVIEPSLSTAVASERPQMAPWTRAIRLRSRRARMTKLVAILCIAAAAEAVADPTPSSLRMRHPRRVADEPPDGWPGDDDVPSTTPEPPVAPPPSEPPPEPPPPAPPPKLDTTIDDGKTEVISVTDSIEHELFVGRTPVTVVTRADLATSGSGTLGDVLQSIPAQANGGNAQVNAGGDGTTRINLRGLGAPRTLVVLNGRRMVNGGPGADSSVDINSIPLAMIERVEIMKDGASALYGADAVGGVVNLITRPQFTGVDASLLTSTSMRGDGAEYDGSLVTGWRSDDKRMYFVVAGGYQRHEPVFAGDRAFSTFQDSFDFATKTATRNLSLAGPSGRLDASSIGSGMKVAGCRSGVCKPDGNGGWTDFATSDLYNEAATQYLYTPSSRYSLIATGGNRINKDTAAYVELLYQGRDSDRQLSPVAFDADVPISKDSIYNPFGADVLDFRRRITELGPRQYLDNARTMRVVAGISGTVPAETSETFAGWNYEASVNYGEAKTQLGTTGQLNKSRLADALGPSMLDASGTPICVRVPGDASTKIIYKIVGLTGPEIDMPCVPLNLFAKTLSLSQLLGPGNLPARGVTYTDAGIGEDSMTTALLTANGRVAKLPHHGEITASIGADYRHEDGGESPPSTASAGGTTDTQGSETDGQFDIAEGFGELSIVPIANDDIAKRVELDFGARAVYYDRFGGALTYKASGLFRTIGGLAARTTYATAFRAPSILDLYGGKTQRLPAAEDPCDTSPPSVGGGTKTLDPMVQAQCTAQGVPVGSKFNTNQQIALVGGNLDLRPETATTTTAGIVYEPPPLPGLALSADYWRIAIHNAIETLGVQTIFANCYDRGLQEFCNQIIRDPYTHRISPVDELLQNVRRTTTSGIDFALTDDARLGEFGRLHTGLEAQYLLRYDLLTSTQQIHGVGFYDLGVYPHWKANLSSRWFHPSGASGGFRLRFIGSYKECASNDCNNPDYLRSESRDVARYYQLDLFGGYDFGSRAGRSTVQLGVNNLLDAAPPTVYNAPAANSDATTYDFIGRLVYVRLSQQF
jgi:outer membrane receptor protein involved in Fe transport